jgi:hypothetical protein
MGLLAGQTPQEVLRGKVESAKSAVEKEPETANRAAVVKALETLLRGADTEEYGAGLGALRRAMPQLDPKTEAGVRAAVLAAYTEVEKRDGRLTEWRHQLALGDESLRRNEFEKAIEAYARVADLPDSAGAPVALIARGRRGRMRAYAARQAAPKPPEKLEQEAKFEAAEEAWKQKVPEGDGHLKALRQLLALRQQSEESGTKRRLEAVRDSYDAYLKSLEAVRDKELLKAGWADRAAIAKRIAAGEDAIANTYAGIASMHEDRAEYAKGAAAYDEVLKLTGASDEVLANAGREKARLLKRAAAGDGPWERWVKLQMDVAQAAWAILRYLVYFLLAGAVYAGVQALLKRVKTARPGVLVEMTDRVPASAARPQDSAATARELKWWLGMQTGATVAGSLADPQRDLDGGGFGNLALSIPPGADAGQFIAESEKVTVGPFSIPVRILYRVWQSIWERPYEYTLRGEAAQFGTTTVAQAAMLPHKGTGDLSLENKWEARIDGTAQISAALEQLSVQVMFGRTPPQRRLTANWRSLWRMRQGLRELRPGDGVEGMAQRLGRAKQALEGAILEDTRNWLARFYLGQTLRRSGENEQALRHLALLLEQARYDAKMRTLVMEAQPLFFVLVLYEQAVVLTKLGRFQEAEQIFAFLLRSL